MNLWVFVGFCDGVIGMVIDIIYEINYQLLEVLIVVGVKFDDYRGFFIIEI